jgi:Cu(I)/Ag(I) efflux system protein CusF
MKSALSALFSAALCLASVLPSAHASPTPESPPEIITARVVKVDLPRSKVTLKHAPIKSVGMAAMTMPFRVRDSAMLAPLKAGNRVRFSVVVQDDELLISQIEVVK